MKREWIKLGAMAAVFGGLCLLPGDGPEGTGPAGEAVQLARLYARRHVLFSLVPALLIAGAITTFVRRGAVVRRLGAGAPRPAAYAVAAVGGAVLTVCSCTVLPLFAGIYRMGAGLGPACALLYAGPAVNILAVALTARVLGWRLGAARAVAAVAASALIGLAMAALFRRAEARRTAAPAALPDEPPSPRPAGKTAAFFAVLVGILLAANWARGGDVRAAFLCCPDGLETYRVEGTVVASDEHTVTLLDTTGREVRIPRRQLRSLAPAPRGVLGRAGPALRWGLAGALLVALGLMIAAWFRPGELAQWVRESWYFAKLVLPLLLAGVLLAGLLLGRPGRGGLIPARWVEMLVGARPAVFLNATGLAGGPAEGALRAAWPVVSNLAAALAGAMMYFATLTEVPILHGLVGAGMGPGPALAMLLAGPAVSLPNLLVIRGVLGTRRTLAFAGLVVLVSALAGLLYGALAPGPQAVSDVSLRGPKSGWIVPGKDAEAGDTAVHRRCRRTPPGANPARSRPELDIPGTAPPPLAHAKRSQAAALHTAAMQRAAGRKKTRPFPDASALATGPGRGPDDRPVPRLLRVPLGSASPPTRQRAMSLDPPACLSVARRPALGRREPAAPIPHPYTTPAAQNLSTQNPTFAQQIPPRRRVA